MVLGFSHPGRLLWNVWNSDEASKHLPTEHTWDTVMILCNISSALCGFGIGLMGEWPCVICSFQFQLSWKYYYRSCFVKMPWGLKLCMVSVYIYRYALQIKNNKNKEKERDTCLATIPLKHHCSQCIQFCSLHWVPRRISINVCVGLFSHSKEELDVLTTH